MLDWSQCPAVERTPGKVGGAGLFTRTRVPVKALFENLESGARIDGFFQWFPGVNREQVEAVLAPGFIQNQYESAFDAIITTDQNLQYQQNLSGRVGAICPCAPTPSPPRPLAVPHSGHTSPGKSSSGYSHLPHRGSFTLIANSSPHPAHADSPTGTLCRRPQCGHTRFTSVIADGAAVASAGLRFSRYRTATPNVLHAATIPAAPVSRVSVSGP